MFCASAGHFPACRTSSLRIDDFQHRRKPCHGMLGSGKILSVLRIRGNDKTRLADLSEKILNDWRNYSDAECDIISHTDGTPHNAITPIARYANGMFELDLVLRNNRTTDEHPLGIFHPHAQHHNIKRENIGLIEVMGLAVLPARLKKEMAALADCIVNEKDPTQIPELQKHISWLESFKGKYTFTKENTLDILYGEIGNTFLGVLLDAGVYKRDANGDAGFDRFVKHLNRG